MQYSEPGATAMTVFSYEADTDGIRVRVRPQWLAGESAPSQGRFVWAYQIEIENASDAIWTLTRRFWKIIDAAGQTQTVEGEGVVGQQPRLEPGNIFRYTSGVPLSVPSGMMGGYYTMQGDHGEQIKAEVPTFSLDSPYDRSRPS